MISSGIGPDPAESSDPWSQPHTSRAERDLAARRAEKQDGNSRESAANPDGTANQPSAAATPPADVPPALRRLAAEVGGDDAVVSQFVADYLSLLDRRVAAVSEAVTAGNAERAEVALLSLESASRMVGADRIVDTAGDLRTAVEDRDFELARGLLERLQSNQTADRTELERGRGAG